MTIAERPDVAVLSPVTHPLILRAPNTCFDSSSEKSRFVLSPMLTRLLATHSPGSIWHDSVVLAVILAISRGTKESTAKGHVLMLSNGFKQLFATETPATIAEFDAPRVLKDIIAKRLLPRVSNHYRHRFVSDYLSAANFARDWHSLLTVQQQEAYQPFLMPNALVRAIRGRGARRQVQLDAEKWRKNRTESVSYKYVQLCAAATLRHNRIKRLHRHLTDIRRQHLPSTTLPYETSYVDREGRGAVRIRVWDRLSLLRDRHVNYIAQKMFRSQKSATKDHLYFELLPPEETATGQPAEEFWFMELLAAGVLGDFWCSEINREFLQRHGYTKNSFRGSTSVLSMWAKADSRFLGRCPQWGRFINESRLIVMSTLARLVVHLVTHTGARIGEIAQVAFDERCLLEVQDLRGKGTTAYALRLIPKGRQSEELYWISDDIIGMIVEASQVAGSTSESATTKRKSTLALCPPYPTNPHQGAGIRPYVFQSRGRNLSTTDLNALVRFMLHGIPFEDRDGKPFAISSHDLRHGFATHALQTKRLSADVVMEMMHQKNIEVTRYYGRATDRQLAEAAGSLWVSRLDYTSMKGRLPSDLLTNLEEAERSVGALSQVPGGTCLQSGYCRIKFDCIGCRCHFPIPSKRYQVTHLKEVAEREMAYHEREGNAIEGRKYREKIRDADIVLEEMDLLAEVMRDSASEVGVQLSARLRALVPERKADP